MNYSHIISDFTWSYSRIAQFELCPYAFLLNYIKHLPGRRNFFSDFGSFMHKLLEDYLSGNIKKTELPLEYVSRFTYEVRGKAPSKEIFNTYFEQGLEYLKNIDFPYISPLAVEKRVDFNINGIPFTGYIDCIAENNGLVIIDNKSRALKPRSKRKKPTKADEELDEFLRQLYIYSVPVKDMFHKYPDRLEFNCFRTKQLISEPFKEEDFEKAKAWATERVKTITENEDWSPKMNYWKCRYICNQSDNCCYFQMNK